MKKLLILIIFYIFCAFAAPEVSNSSNFGLNIHFSISELKAQNDNGRKVRRRPKVSRSETRPVDTNVPIPGSLIIIGSLLSGSGIFYLIRKKYFINKKRTENETECE